MQFKGRITDTRWPLHRHHDSLFTEYILSATGCFAGHASFEVNELCQHWMKITVSNQRDWGRGVPLCGLNLLFSETEGTHTLTQPNRPDYPLYCTPDFTAMPRGSGLASVYGPVIQEDRSMVWFPAVTPCGAVILCESGGSKSFHCLLPRLSDETLNRGPVSIA